MQACQVQLTLRDHEAGRIAGSVKELVESGVTDPDGSAYVGILGLNKRKSTEDTLVAESSRRDRFKVLDSRGITTESNGSNFTQAQFCTEI